MDICNKAEQQKCRQVKREAGGQEEKYAYFLPAFDCVEWPKILRWKMWNSLPDISVLTGHSNILLRYVDIHVVQGRFLSNVVSSDEVNSVRHLRSENEPTKI